MQDMGGHEYAAEREINMHECPMEQDMDGHDVLGTG